jgi:hypothetical protein
MRGGVVVVCGLLAGCVTARASVGPHVSTAGKGGVTALAGYGFGWSVRDHQAFYVAATGGVGGDGHARGMLVDNLDYVNAALPVPMRISMRFGALFGREKYLEGDRALLGFAVALFPWHGGLGGGGGYHSEKGWDDVVPEVSMSRGLGIELATDVLPATGATDSLPAQRAAMMVTVGLVAEIDGMMDR